MRARSDAGTSTVRVESVSGDDAGHVRPVAIVVVGIGTAAGEIDEAIDPLGPAVREVVVPGAHARVDDGDADAGAVVAERLAYRARANRRPGPFECAADHPVD